MLAPLLAMSNASGCGYERKRECVGLRFQRLADRGQRGVAVHATVLDFAANAPGGKQP